MKEGVKRSIIVFAFITFLIAPATWAVVGIVEGQ